MITITWSYWDENGNLVEEVCDPRDMAPVKAEDFEEDPVPVGSRWEWTDVDNFTVKESDGERRRIVWHGLESGHGEEFWLTVAELTSKCTRIDTEASRKYIGFAEPFRATPVPERTDTPAIGSPAVEVKVSTRCYLCGSLREVIRNGVPMCNRCKEGLGE